MIRTFRGRGRALGTGDSHQFELAIEAELRNHLGLFKGSSLNVFICIALHIDDLGWAFPTIPTITRETKRDDATVHRALNHLVKMEIDGERLLLRAKTPPRHIDPAKIKSKRPRNFYLLFPSREEIARYEMPSQNRDAKIETSQNRDAKIARQSITNKKDSPEKGFKETPTHSRAGAGAEAERRPTAGLSIYDWEVVEAWGLDVAKKDPAIRSARALAVAAYKSGTSDLFIQLWLAEREAGQAVGAMAGAAGGGCSSTCPLCFGAGMYYPDGFDKGVAKCPNAGRPKEAGGE